MSTIRQIEPDVHGGPPPNLVDYDEGRERFSWEQARATLDGLPGGRGLNIAHEAVVRHVEHGRGDVVALRWRGRDGTARDITYRELDEESGRFANALAALGVEPGDVVVTLLGRVPQLYATVIGTLRHRAVLSPLLSVFGPEPIRQRIDLAAARVLVTTPSLYRRRIAPMRDELSSLRHVILVGEGDVPAGAVAWDAVVGAAEPVHRIPPTRPDDLALLHFTSGTTGLPKGAMHVHEAVVAHGATGSMVLDLRPGDVYWCTADPGWVTGTSYGIVAPLVHGVTSVIDEGDFEAGRWYELLERERVDVWYTAPTAVRMLMKAGPEPRAGRDLSALRLVASVGEPLHPEAVLWGEEVLGLPIRDNWWQTETGGIMVANYRCLPVRPGSMGRPLPGIEAVLLARDEHGEVVLDAAGEPVTVTEPDREGELALRAGWPSMFRGYLGQPERYARCFAGPWYRTGDLARRDADGWFWFAGRADDVIKSAGHLIGPTEVEQALLAHPAVTDAGVIGVPDPVAGEVVKAFVSLAAGFEPSDELRLELIGFARTRLGPAVAPRALAFDQHLPTTRSGKIMRRVLKARELGLSEGDLSTLESGGPDQEVAR
ncbi:acetate--CoA ligase [Actinomarinicola tropica]|uniref:acetate--CoA ligase n=1 Tax=Actinomarinicola tropica TaxID=2789776 RepID=A0A5Q2RNU7_9ACTN|nr:acetate--CoA ligase [Actinomarinicola tropica]QGG96622.1 acetate--CoA ligase [Actinomarinicola tropica]